MKPEKLIEILLRVLIMSCLIEQNVKSESESIPVQEKE
jgi:hypothetical protein